MTEWIHARRAGVVLASSLLASTTACSYAFVRGPPPVIETTPGVQQRAASECTTSNAAPVVDTVVSVPFIGLGGLAIAALIATSSDSCSEFCFRAPGAYAGIAAASFALGAIFIASAATGYG